MNPKLVIQPEDRTTRIKDTMVLRIDTGSEKIYMPECLSEYVPSMGTGAIEQTCPYLSVEELKFLYDIADQINTFHDKRARETGSNSHHPEITFRSSPWTGFRPVRKDNQMLISW